METISQVLFWVANSLLIPDILLLLLLFIPWAASTTNTWPNARTTSD